MESSTAPRGGFADLLAATRLGLKDFRFVEGQNFEFEYAFPSGHLSQGPLDELGDASVNDCRKCGQPCKWLAMTTYGLKYVARTVDTGGGSDRSAKANAKICTLFGSTDLQGAACKPRKKSQPALGLPRSTLIYH